MKEIENLLKSIVGLNNISRDEEICISYSYSCFSTKNWERKPDIVVLPKTTEQVAKIIKVANRYKIPVTPKGATGWGGHGGPLKGGILIDLSHMDKIILIDVENMKTIAEAGCSFFKLSQELFKKGLMLPTTEYGPGPNVAASAIAPVNAFGKTRYGRNIDLVEGFEIVLPTGEIIKIGSMAYANTKFGPFYRYITGPDLVGLFTQSNGAYGIITKVAYRCLKLPKYWSHLSYWWPLEKIEEVAKVLAELTAFEIFDVHINDKWKYAGVLQTNNSKMFPENMHFIIMLTIHAENKEELKGKEKYIEEICTKNGGLILPGIAKIFFTAWPTMFSPVSNPMAVQLFQTSNKVSGGNFMHIYDSINYPISKFPEVYNKLMTLEKKYELWGFPRLSWLDGFVMKSLVMCSQSFGIINVNDKIWVNQIKKLKEEFREWFGKMGGTFQSQLPPMVPDYAWTNQPGTHFLLKKIKNILDPNNILSPGTF